ncbi:hypothetical protein EOA13_25810 [Mesorhizobium sp. M7A.F.Ca.US.011.01.1.1]|uniref:hypothetical protein n=1 Tax=Mesorhizobium sp. M7A.F.Ca.US.011.01.1.1 TaxID=2496741 RepID=UPI000FCC550C|nr:hypothetical protein [Mesorhizobium sp. M7A.F.Ca.US.011.01.1.1]RUX25824.1 hypothetical protein EOA13_25810 [Mesorhizobium sp. M7A.F.Ca.US.011.01.1.1]
MTFGTDERLKSYLDTNQLQRERMCTAVLALDKRFTNVRPRHPRGGPDGGRDIEAILNGEQKTYGAIGFVNQASDSTDHKKKAQKKFSTDLASATAADPEIKAFVFFTNVNLTAGEKNALVEKATKSGLAYCEIFDRERIRLVLDGADGMAIRFQSLGIPMSDAEQATFFARWGDDIQSVIADGFSEIKRSLNRMQFLHEMNAPLEQFLVLLELDREYNGSEIGHLRFFVSMSLAEPRDGLLMVTFGTSDRADRARAKSVADVEAMRAGILHGMMGAKWERRIPTSEDEPEEDAADSDESVDDGEGTSVGTFTSVGLENVRFLRAEFGYGGGSFRFGPYLRLSDIDDSMIALFMNKSLAEKVKAIHFFGNQYKLAEYERDGFRIDTHGKFEPNLIFTPSELTDEWRRIMRNFGPFSIRYSEMTPIRLFEPVEVSNSLPVRRSRMAKS